MNKEPAQIYVDQYLLHLGWRTRRGSAQPRFTARAPPSTAHPAPGSGVRGESCQLHLTVPSRADRSTALSIRYWHPGLVDKTLSSDVKGL